MKDFYPKTIDKPSELQYKLSRIITEELADGTPRNVVVNALQKLKKTHEMLLKIERKL